MQRDNNKSNPQTLHEDRYIKYFTQTQSNLEKETFDVHQTELHLKELTIRNLGSLCDKLFNASSVYHQKQKFGFVQNEHKKQKQQENILLNQLEENHRDRLIQENQKYNSQKINSTVKKVGTIKNHKCYIFFHSISIIITELDKSKELIQIPIHCLANLIGFPQKQVRDIILISLKKQRANGGNVYDYFTDLEQISDDYIDDTHIIPQMIIHDYQIESGKYVTIEINIFFSIQELNYDNDIYPNHNQIQQLINLNFINLETIIENIYNQQQDDMKNIENIHSKPTNESVDDVVQVTINDQPEEILVQVIGKQKEGENLEDAQIKQKLEAQFFKNSQIHDNKIFSIVFYPHQITYIPVHRLIKQKQIKYTLTIKEFCNLVIFSQKSHVIDFFSEEIQNFHNNIIAQIRNTKVQEPEQIAQAEINQENPQNHEQPIEEQKFETPVEEFPENQETPQEEQNVENLVENPVETPVENPVETPVENPVETPFENPVDQPEFKPKNDQFFVENGNLKVGQSKINKNKIILSLSSLNQELIFQNIQKIDEVMISNGILESCERNYDVDFQTFRMIIQAPRIEVHQENMTKPAVLPCSVHIINKMIAEQFSFNMEADIQNI